MAIKGSLKEASLADVCQLLSLGQKTGCLSISDRSNFGQIYFEQGRITYARVVNRRDRLGDLLVRDGLITHDQLRRAVDQQSRNPDLRLGEILIERRLIEPEQLEWYIQQQIEEAVYHLFTWSQGTFYFEVDQTPPEGEHLASINPESLLLEAARRVDEWSLIAKKIPSLDLIFEAEQERVRGAGVDLTPEQERVLPLLDGTRTLRQIVDQTGLVEFDVGKAVFGLIQAGFAHRMGTRAPHTNGNRVREAEVAERRNLGVAFYRAGMAEEATREFRQVLELRPDDPSAGFHLALLALRQGKEREAVRRLKMLVEASGASYAAFVNLAFAFMRLGRAEDALLALHEAEAIRPATPKVALMRAAVHIGGGDTDGATETLAEYQLRLRPGDTPTAPFYHFAALVAGLAGRLDMAQSTIEEGLATHSESAPLLLLAGAIAERRGDLDRAERYYAKAADIDSSLPQVHKNQGDIAYRRGDHEGAIEHYRRALELDPRLGDDIYTKLGNVHYKQQNREEALRCWRIALEINPANEVVRNNLEVVAHVAG